MKKKITDMSNFKHNPEKYYEGLVAEIEEYIEKYSTEINENDLTRSIPDEELTKEEKGIAKEIGKIITTACQKYKKRKYWCRRNYNNHQCHTLLRIQATLSLQNIKQRDIRLPRKSKRI